MIANSSGGGANGARAQNLLCFVFKEVVPQQPFRWGVIYLGIETRATRTLPLAGSTETKQMISKSNDTLTFDQLKLRDCYSRLMRSDFSYGDCATSFSWVAVSRIAIFSICHFRQILLDSSSRLIVSPRSLVCSSFPDLISAMRAILSEV